ncbi:hypothetical protein CSA08_05095 [Candidatus Gracilibacteria bacterium]|nr:MAG: hypothetical protein CSA08_05095 [Candidatus Gracilibacteria bacterium]
MLRREKTRLYSGANGNKIGIIYENINYMLKFPPKPNKNPEMSYTNSCISEYVSCKIIETLGLNVQKTLLGKYKDKIVVACKDFEEEKFKLLDFASLKNSVVDSETGGNDTELTEVLFTINNQNKIKQEKLIEFFWDMFIADTLLANYDRHNGNWGILLNKNTKEFEIAPIYDCGSCLFPQNTDDEFEIILKNKSEMENRIFSSPRSSFNKKGRRINYFTLLTTTDNQDCLKSLKKIHSRIDMDKINKIIEETPYITDIHKLFLKTIIKARKEKILDKALEINKNFQ